MAVTVVLKKCNRQNYQKTSKDVKKYDGNLPQETKILLGLRWTFTFKLHLNFQGRYLFSINFVGVNWTPKSGLCIGNNVKPYLLHGLGSSVGMATDYGLDGPGSNQGGDEFFRPYRPALGPTQPPVKWEPGLSQGKVRLGPAADHLPPSSAAVMEE